MNCYHCGKGLLFGRSHTHHRGVAGGRWKKRAQKTQRIFKPNLQPVIIIEDGEEIRVKLCMKCLKRIKKDITDGKRPFLILKNLINMKPRAKEEVSKTPVVAEIEAKEKEEVKKAVKKVKKVKKS